MSADGIYVNLRFAVVGTVGSKTPITITAFRMNDGTDQARASGGEVELTASNTASIQGRLLTAFGKPIASARVMLTSTEGDRVSFTSRANGSFDFWNLTVGQTYSLAARSTNFNFLPQTVSVVENVTDVDVIAEP